jgi:hypothetical protein
MAVALATASGGLGAESIIDEHSADIVNLLTWAVTGLFTALVTLIIAYVASKFSDRNSRFDKALVDLSKKMDRIEAYLATDIDGIKADIRQERLRTHANQLDIERIKTRMHMAGIPQPVDCVREDFNEGE